MFRTLLVAVLMAMMAGAVATSAVADPQSTPASFTVPQAQALALANGLVFDAPYLGGDDVEVFDATGTYVAQITGLPDVTALVASLDGHTVYAGLAGKSVVAIDTTSLTVLNRYDVTDLGVPNDLVQVGSRLYVTAYTAPGTEIGVVDLAGDTPHGVPLYGTSVPQQRLAVRAATDSTDQLYILNCGSGTSCVVIRGEYSLTSGTATFSDDPPPIANLEWLATSSDGSSIIATHTDGTVDLRDPADLGLRSSFAGAPGGGRPIVTVNGIVQSAQDRYLGGTDVEEHALDGTPGYQYAPSGARGLVPLASPDGSTLVVAQPASATSRRTITVLRGALRTLPAPVGSAATPSQPGMFVSTAPARLLDTRSSLGASRPGAGGTIHLTVLGQGPVPASNVSAVVLTLSAVGATSSGYLTAYADTSSRPRTSALNFPAGRTVSNLATVPVGSNGRIAIYNGSAGSTQVTADVAGYYVGGSPADAGAFVSTTPTRVLDTRSAGHEAIDGHTFQQLRLPGAGPVPATGFSAVAVNIAVIGATQSGYLTAYPEGIERPGTSNVNFAAGPTVANAAIVQPGADDTVMLYNGSSRSVDVAVDVVGYYLDGAPADAGAFVPVAPARILDTRTSLGASPPASMGTITSAVGGQLPVPRGESAVLINLAVVGPQSKGYLTAYPHGQPRPNSSSLNFATPDSRAGLAAVRLGEDGSIDLYDGSVAGVQVVGDLAGYFLTAPLSEMPPNAARAVDVSPQPRGGSAAGCAAPPYPFLGVTFRLTLGAHVSDPNVGGAYIRAHFRLRDFGRYGSGPPTDVVGFGDDAGRSTPVNPAGGYAAAFLDASGLVDGHLYAADEETDDGVRTGAVSPACRFTLDATPPNDLTITPGQTSYHVGTPAHFDVASTDPLPAGGGDASLIDHFDYSTSSAADLAGDGGTHVAATPASNLRRSATISFTPTLWGASYLYVASVDAAGNQSAVSTFTYYVVG